MATEIHTEIKYSIDRFVISGRRVFCWGWAADRTCAIREAWLCLEGAGWNSRLSAVLGLERLDVQAAFAGWVNAASSGFVVTGYLPQARPQRMFLEIAFVDGSEVKVDVSHVALEGGDDRKQRRHFAWLLRAVWRRLKHGDIKGIVRRARAQNYGAASLDERGVASSVLPLLEGLEASIVFDHNMGGGANHYRRRIVAERLASGRAVVQCTYNLPTLDYRLTVMRPGAEDLVFRVATFELLEGILAEAAVVELFVNSPVSFDEPLLFAEWIAGLRRKHQRARLVVTAHDFLSVCPSFVLLNAEGRYCGIPEPAECNRCMQRHESSFVALSPRTQIGPWRALWGDCLQTADEIRCFSESTVRLLTRAYPNLPRERVRIVPHESDYTPARLPRVERTDELVIGVIGHISFQKGATIVKELVETLEREEINARVVVIGTLDLALPSKRLRVTGQYTRDQLVDLVETHRINAFLFPSIWPETFSYVVSEIMALDMPIAAFDLGAPADRLRGYAKASLCREVSAAAALESLVSLHRQLGSSTNGEPARLRAAGTHGR